MPLTLAEARAQLVANHTKWTTGAEGMPVQDDLDARVAEANATHTQVTNSQLDPSHVNVNTGPVGFGGVAGLKSYAGGNIVALPAEAVGDTDDLQYMVRTALDADLIHDKGSDVDSPVTDYTPAIDGTWLIEASKQTGEKLF